MMQGPFLKGASLLACLCLAGAAQSDSTKTPVTATVKGDVIEFHAGKELVTRYHIDKDLSKPYFFPVLAPGGLKVTRGVPPDKGDATDHPHQSSVWFCHGDVIPEGIELKNRIKGVKGVDYWSIAPGHGRMVCTKAEAVSKEEAYVATSNERRTADGVKIMDEARHLKLLPVEGGYLFVIDIDLFASVCPITFGDTKEGSMGIRVPNPMTEKLGKGLMTNGEGKTGMKAIWGQPSKWCDYSGTVTAAEGAPVAGIALFDHPDNKPQACWHARDYGLMAANPFGRASFPGGKAAGKLVQLEKGGHLKLRYGLFLHKGDVKEGKVAEAYAQFVKVR